jgi:hypothetical protein
VYHRLRLRKKRCNPVEAGNKNAPFGASYASNGAPSAKKTLVCNPSPDLVIPDDFCFFRGHVLFSEQAGGVAERN